MRRKKRSLYDLVLGLVALVVLLILWFFVPPSSSWSLFIVKISPLLPFLVLSGLVLYFLPTFFLKSKQHGILISVFVVLYLLFRLWGLTHPFFAILLLALFLTLELLFTRKPH